MARSLITLRNTLIFLYDLLSFATIVSGQLHLGQPHQDHHIYCQDSPCLNGGTCSYLDPPHHHDPHHDPPQQPPPQHYPNEDQPHEDHFTCQCTHGWTGLHCERGLAGHVTGPGPHVYCHRDDNPCLHGGTCFPNDPAHHHDPHHDPPHFPPTQQYPHQDQPHEDHFTCQCKYGWTGLHCERETHFEATEFAHGIYADVHVGRCAANPCVIDGTCTLHDPTYTCRCVDDWTAQECNTATGICMHYKCNNGGHCISDNGRVYCQGCHDRWHGDDCGTADNCHQLVCIHGYCKELEPQGPPGPHSPPQHGARCHCSQGWTGFECRTDQCLSLNPCQNGGTCIITHWDYSCSCLTGWTGSHCQTVTDQCLPLNPCQNGGKCINTLGNYSCTCVQGWTGPQCQSDLDECSLSNPCQNGGTCMNKPGNYTCRCDGGWTGAQCLTDIDECMNTTCQNGGTCVNTPGHFICQCANNWTDTYCQTDMFPKCNHTCSLDAVILSNPVVKGTTDCSGTTTLASNEALPELCCHMRAHADWQHGEQVQDNGVCIDGKIPPYTPIAAVNGTQFSNAGIFYGCIKNGLPGFMMIRQDCTTLPQLLHVNTSTSPSPDKYFVIY